MIRLGSIPICCADCNITDGTRENMDKFTYELKQVITNFKEAWIDREALRIKRRIESAGETCDWEKTLAGARILAEKVFDPALAELDGDSPLSMTLEQLNERLRRS